MATKPKNDGKKNAGSGTPPAEPKKDLPAPTGGANQNLMIQGDSMPEHIKAAMGTGSQAGSENVGTEDLVIPRLEILQAISPHVMAGNAEYHPSHKPGDFVNSVTNENYGQLVFLVPVYFEKLFLVWVDRKTGGGFRGAYKTMEEAQARADEEGGKAKGIEVIDTPTHLCLLVRPDVGKIEEIMVPLPRTKAKVSRAWNSQIRLAGGDRWLRIYRAQSSLEKNAKGQYYNFAIAPVGWPTPTVMKAAKELYASVASGTRNRTMDLGGASAPGEENTEM
jgi:hypothetical protein